MAEHKETDGQMLGPGDKGAKALPGHCTQETPSPSPLPQASRATVPLPLPSPESAEAALLSSVSVLSPARLAAPIQEPPPPTHGFPQAVVEPPVSAAEQRPPITPLPTLLPSSPVRRCLSSSAAAISRYLAASCISQSLARKNGAPQAEELQAPCRPLPASQALPRYATDPLALLPKGAPKAPSNLAKARSSRDTSQVGCTPRCFGARPPSPARQRAWSVAGQAPEQCPRFSSASEPNSRVQSPSHCWGLGLGLAPRPSFAQAPPGVHRSPPSLSVPTPLGSCLPTLPPRCHRPRALLHGQLTGHSVAVGGLKGTAYPAAG
uniref:Uncharacterized protein n=1 Tax=Sphaerodactylus townsendi TaxID=933632 RepID=A0ACB8FSV8_9SAUR